MELVVVRHGQTEENVRNIFQGHIPGELSEKGIEQAKNVATLLRNHVFDHMYVSDLKRTVDTAEHIRAFHQHTPYTLTEQLRELHGGDSEGKYSHNLTWESNVHPWDRRQPNGENFRELKHRVCAFIDSLSQKHEDDTVLLVTHGGPIRALVARADKLEGEDVFEVIPDNCQVLKFTWGNPPRKSGSNLT